MKSKYVLIWIFSLTILGLSSIVHAAAYSLGVSTGSSQTYTVIKTSSSYTSYTTEGNSFTLEVLSVEDALFNSKDHWKLSLKVTAAGKADRTEIYYVSKTPTFGIAFICPLSVSSFLTAADAATGGSADVSGTSFSYVDATGVKIEYSYDATTGWATLQRKSINGEVVLEVQAGAASTNTGNGTIPGYELTVVLGISVIFFMSKMLLLKRKSK